MMRRRVAKSLVDLDDVANTDDKSLMPRKMRVEYPGAIYHVMSRGDRREDIFLVDASLAHLGRAQGSQHEPAQGDACSGKREISGRSDWDMSLEQIYLWVDPCDPCDERH